MTDQHREERHRERYRKILYHEMTLADAIAEDQAEDAERQQANIERVLRMRTREGGAT